MWAKTAYYRPVSKNADHAEEVAPEGRGGENTDRHRLVARCHAIEAGDIDFRYARAKPRFLRSRIGVLA